MTVRSGRYVGGKIYTDAIYEALVRSAAIKPPQFRQTLEDALKTAGFSFEEDKMGVEKTW